MMIRQKSGWLSHGWACGLLLMSAVPSFAADEQAAGVVRISKPSTRTVRAQSDAITPANCQTDGGFVTSDCPTGACPTGAFVSGDCLSGDCYGGKVKGGWRTADVSHSAFRQRTQAHSLGMEALWTNKYGCHPGFGGYHTGSDMKNYFLCKFGYFVPTGNGGTGAPFIGSYARVYPQDPSYFDQRDGQLWGAEGYGAPVAVPLAPVVGHQYNYSWGIPSSRLTPISRLAPQ